MSAGWQNLILKRDSLYYFCVTNYYTQMAKKHAFITAFRADVFQKLEASLTDLKGLTTEKSFQARLTKAAKILTDDIKEKKAVKEQDAPGKKKAAPKKGKEKKVAETVTAPAQATTSADPAEQAVNAPAAKKKSGKK